MMEPLIWLLIGFLLGMIVMHEIWRWLYRKSARLIQEQAEYIAMLEEPTP